MFQINTDRIIEKYYNACNDIIICMMPGCGDNANIHCAYYYNDPYYHTSRSKYYGEHNCYCLVCYERDNPNVPFGYDDEDWAMFSNNICDLERCDCIDCNPDMLDNIEYIERTFDMVNLCEQCKDTYTDFVGVFGDNDVVFEDEDGNTVYIHHIYPHLLVEYYQSENTPPENYNWHDSESSSEDDEAVIDNVNNFDWEESDEVVEMEELLSQMFSGEYDYYFSPEN